MTKRLNAVTASGLMIGPILGSGIIFLPPLAYEALGEHAIIAWVIIMALGALFAYVFARMTTAVPNNQGISAVVSSMLGKRFGKLAANYLTIAVVFGPAAVSIIAAEFIGTILPFTNGSGQIAVAAVVLLFSAMLVLSDVAILGKFMLILSSLTACLLLIGSLATLFTVPSVSFPQSFPPVTEMGHTLLLIFWAIVGWEVLGNYAEDVENPARTLMRAMKISILIIVLVYLITAFALQNSGASPMSGLLTPLFGQYAALLFSLLATCLCILTIVTFTGAVTRQTVARLYTTHIPPIFQKKCVSVFLLLALNLIVLGCHALGWLSFESIVAMANVLFIGNAALGLVAGFRLLHSVHLRIGIVILLLMMLAILVFSPVYAIIFFLAVTVGSQMF